MRGDRNADTTTTARKVIANERVRSGEPRRTVRAGRRPMSPKKRGWFVEAPALGAACAGPAMSALARVIDPPSRRREHDQRHDQGQCEEDPRERRAVGHRLVREEVLVDVEVQEKG